MSVNKRSILYTLSCQLISYCEEQGSVVFQKDQRLGEVGSPGSESCLSGLLTVISSNYFTPVFPQFPQMQNRGNN